MDDSIKELLVEVPKKLQDVFLQLVARTDAFCEAHLNSEYQQVCREMAAAFCQKGSPVAKGKLEGWAAGIVYSVGWVNFLTDPHQKPHLKAAQIAQGMGVSEATMQAKARVIRQALDVDRFDPGFTVPSMMKENPFIWMTQLKNGLIVDLRMAPREVQEEAFRRGMIPYVPADRGEGVDEHEEQA